MWYTLESNSPNYAESDSRTDSGGAESGRFEVRLPDVADGGRASDVPLRPDWVSGLRCEMWTALGIHLGVLALLLGGMYGLIRLRWLDAEYYLMMPAVFFIYLGAFWIISGVKARRRRQARMNEK